MDLNAAFDARLSAMMPQIVQAVQTALSAQGAPPAQTIGAVPAPDAFGGLGVATAAPAQPAVTAEQLQALIMPLVANETIKAALTAEMNAMGIQNLGDARLDQYGELYGRFQRVAAQYTQPASGQPAAQVGGII